jgi:hypothetical protein
MNGSASRLDPELLAGVLTELAQEIEALGAHLCADPAIAASQCETLQAIDLIAQKQQALATIVKADCAGCAISRVGIETLERKLAVSSRCDCIHRPD